MTEIPRATTPYHGAVVLLVALVTAPLTYAQSHQPIKHIPATIDSSTTFQTWDGFGFNYVEAAQTRNDAAFASNGTSHPDAFVIVSAIKIWKLPFKIQITGTEATRFQAYRSTQDGKEKYRDPGVHAVTDGHIVYDPPFGSVTTFMAIE